MRPPCAPTPDIRSGWALTSSAHLAALLTLDLVPFGQTNAGGLVRDPLTELSFRLLHTNALSIVKSDTGGSRLTAFVAAAAPSRVCDDGRVVAGHAQPPPLAPTLRADAPRLGAEPSRCFDDITAAGDGPPSAAAAAPPQTPRRREARRPPAGQAAAGDGLPVRLPRAGRFRRGDSQRCRWATAL